MAKGRKSYGTSSSLKYRPGATLAPLWEIFHVLKLSSSLNSFNISVPCPTSGYEWPNKSMLVSPFLFFAVLRLVLNSGSELFIFKSL